MIVRTHHLPRAAAMVAGLLLVAACRPEASASPSALDPDPTTTLAAPADPMVPPTTVVEPMVPAAEPAEVADEVQPPGDMSSEDVAAITQRCIDAAVLLDQRIDDEDFDFPEEPELDDEELEEVMTPAPEFDDGVAGPDERPDLTPMPDFDPATVPILELDLMVESCIESGIVTEDELYPDDGTEDDDADGEDAEGDEGDDDGDAEFCAELAALSPEEIREFAAEDGDEVVREEFAYCNLPDPLGS